MVKPWETLRCANELMYTIKSRGLRIEPWGKPVLTGSADEEWPFRTTLWLRSER